jgi:inhibitor of cysteine peptidase
MRTAIPIIITVMILLGVSALATTVVLAPASANPPVSPVSIDERANNTTLHLRPEQMVELVLEENPTTGYSWTLTLPEGLNVETDEYRSMDRGSTSSPLVGAGGDHVWRFRAVRPGTYLVQGSYARSWEITPEDRSFHLTIQVE